MRRLTAAPRALTFQFTPLREGRRENLARYRATQLFQFTPLREGRHPPRRRRTRPTAFQFTPLREGRRAAVRHLCQAVQFQFTPLREGRREAWAKGNRLKGSNFNSRPCGRGDCLLVFRRVIDHISIHAPAGGATQKHRQNCHAGKYFNSRPCGRGDLQSSGIMIMALIFQFTPLREGRPDVPFLGALSKISIHAPAGGATRSPLDLA